MNLFMKRTDTHTENILVLAKGEVGWGKDRLGVWGYQMQTII